MDQGRRHERMIALAIAAAFALNYPLLYLFQHPHLLFGIPLLYLYLFVVWAVVIACSALVMLRVTPRAIFDRDPRLGGRPDA